MSKSFKVGESASFTMKIERQHIDAFSSLTGDDNPVHLDEEYAASTRFKGCIAHGMLTASLISTVLGTRLPGPGAVYIRQNLSFLAPVYPGDEVTATATVTAFDQKRRRLTMKTACVNQKGTEVLTGEAELLV